ncbi:zonular occludens toxin domain-containing protein [Lysobacter sp.]|uniref:zonular occludens toxin domain-containing protein n=1 Tax=Lysobacter sp. TaxID=72226 RepID=UPI002D6254E0|nr:zonular occludens toxin domain-containing protein [Lysobacter sp.]HZX76823.1 zonular occludens toxin domain-containing protein [Lysobacter sp.]
MISKNKPIFTEPKCLVTGVEGAGKTLFAVQQADLLTKEEGGLLYTLNIRGADPGHLPKLPFALSDMAYNDDGSPVVDSETGDHLPKWATLPPGSVIVVDEAHKVFPQRGPGRPPKYIEMLAEGRQFGIRFILLSQAPSSMDGFLRERISRHYHLERKGNMERATVFEFDHCVLFPRTAWQERKDAQVHFWSYPKDYYGWYTSAKSHHFKLRIPVKVIVALLAIPAMGYAAYAVIDKVGGIMDGDLLASAQASAVDVELGDGRLSERKPRAIARDAEAYEAQFEPIVPYKPWSAPAYQDREITAEPDLFCMAAAAGQDANGEHREASCTCHTEQGTPYAVDPAQCRVYASKGVYNPFRTTARARGNWSSDDGRGKPGKARSGPSGVRADSGGVGGYPPTAMTAHAVAPSSGAVLSAPQVSGYGDILVGQPQSAPR